MIRCLARSVTASAAASRLSRALTSTNTRSRRRRATMSISPTGVFQRRAAIQWPLAMSSMAARLSADRPSRNAATRSGRGPGLAGPSGSARRAITGVLTFVLGQRQRALIELPPRQAGGLGHFADGVLERNTGQRLAQHGVGVA